MNHRTPTYWPTRILLGIGIVTTGLTVGLAPMVLLQDSVFRERPGAVVVVASAMALTGLAWMIRIFRGPRDEPPPWRYRDR